MHWKGRREPKVLICADCGEVADRETRARAREEQCAEGRHWHLIQDDGYGEPFAKGCDCGSHGESQMVEELELRAEPYYVHTVPGSPELRVHEVRWQA